jgi:hypothetical protein
MLSLFYLANDVIQNCKRKNAKILQDAFKPYISDGVILIQNDETIRPNIERIFNVWRERNVYEKDYLDKLQELISIKKRKFKQPLKKTTSTNNQLFKSTAEEVNTKELEIQKLIAEFQVSLLL